MLRFPRQMMSGWYLRDSTGRLRGLAVLNIIPTDHGRTRVGKVVDCLLDNIDVDHWHAAMFALTSELKHQDADVVQAYASTPGVSKHFGEAAINRDMRLSFISATARV